MLNVTLACGRVTATTRSMLVSPSTTICIVLRQHAWQAVDAPRTRRQTRGTHRRFTPTHCNPRLVIPVERQRGGRGHSSNPTPAHTVSPGRAVGGGDVGREVKGTNRAAMRWIASIKPALERSRRKTNRRNHTEGMHLLNRIL